MALATIALFLCNKWNIKDFLREKTYQNTLQIVPFTNILRELACLQTYLAGTWLQFFIIFVIYKAKQFPGSMLSNPASNRVALTITISCIKSEY